jgi:hypothetical protein
METYMEPIFEAVGMSLEKDVLCAIVCWLTLESPTDLQMTKAILHNWSMDGYILI